MTSAILAVGLLGPHLSRGPQPTSTQSPPAQLSTPSQTKGPPDLAGLAPSHLAPSDIRMSWLSDAITSRSLAAIGTRIFYIVGANKIESTVIGSDALPQTLVSVPTCRTIHQVAAAGNLIGYVETSPVGPPLDGLGCGESNRIAWSIWLCDLQGGHPRQVAFGIRPATSDETVLYPVHVALTETAYAFEVPISSDQLTPFEQVEVHSTEDARLLWSAQTDGGVWDILLGGKRLAVLTDGTLMTDSRLELWIADAVFPQLRRVGQPFSSAAISEDGAYLAWDARNPWERASGTSPLGLIVYSLDTRSSQNVSPPEASSSAEPLRPVVSSDLAGPIVAWYATAREGAVYLAFQDAANKAGVALSSVQSPTWIGLRGSTLIWAASGLRGGVSAVFAADLSLARTAAP